MFEPERRGGKHLPRFERFQCEPSGPFMPCHRSSLGDASVNLPTIDPTKCHRAILEVHGMVISAEQGVQNVTARLVKIGPFTHTPTAV